LPLRIDIGKPRQNSCERTHRARIAQLLDSNRRKARNDQTNIPVAAVSLRNGLARIARNDKHWRGGVSRPLVERGEKRPDK
jgi:hypothetical protein